MKVIRKYSNTNPAGRILLFKIYSHYFVKTFLIKYITPRSASMVCFIPAIFGPVRLKKREEETGGVLDAQLLTALGIRRVDGQFISSSFLYSEELRKTYIHTSLNGFL